MKKIMVKLRLVLMISMMSLPAILMAQNPDDPPTTTPPVPGDDPTSTGPDVNDNDVPFDGGVSLLIAAGIGYGLKKVYSNKKEEKDKEVVL